MVGVGTRGRTKRGGPVRTFVSTRVTIQLGVAGTIDRAHAAFADLGGDWDRMYRCVSSGFACCPCP